MQIIFGLQWLLNFSRKLFSKLILQIHNVKFQDKIFLIMLRLLIVEMRVSIYIDKINLEFKNLSFK